MAPLGFHHTGRTVRSMDAALQFYCSIVGFEIETDIVVSDPQFDQFLGTKGASVRAVMLSVGGSRPFMELFEFLRVEGSPATKAPAVVDLGSTHPCFRVSDIHDEYRRLTELGVRVTREPMRLDGGPFEGQWILYAFDPDGAIVEFWQD